MNFQTFRGYKIKIVRTTSKKLCIRTNVEVSVSAQFLGANPPPPMFQSGANKCSKILKARLTWGLSDYPYDDNP